MDKIKFPIQSEDIWYSTKRRMTSKWKVFAMDDRGELDIYENRIQFIGEKNRLNINNIKNIFITRPTPGYGAHIVSELISIIFSWYVFLIVFSSIEYFLTIFVIIIVLFPVSLLLTKSDWIGIEYNISGNLKKAFFTDGSFPKGSVLRSKNTASEPESLFERFQAIKIDDNE